VPNIFLRLTGVPLRSTPAGEKCVRAACGGGTNWREMQAIE
jgi:hypothetical protein